mmetsp:Transcript_14867/g.47335  ORF Transcript_14867/g.47335 Transcript_14867/m.47335 type:complete len:249 (-) Transcript_14867:154-900(-)
MPRLTSSLEPATRQWSHERALRASQRSPRPWLRRQTPLCSEPARQVREQVQSGVSPPRYRYHQSCCRCCCPAYSMRARSRRSRAASRCCLPQGPGPLPWPAGRARDCGRRRAALQACLRGVLGAGPARWRAAIPPLVARRQALLVCGLVDDSTRRPNRPPPARVRRGRCAVGWRPQRGPKQPSRRRWCPEGWTATRRTRRPGRSASAQSRAGGAGGRGGAGAGGQGSAAVRRRGPRSWPGRPRGRRRA